MSPQGADADHIKMLDHRMHTKAARVEDEIEEAFDALPDEPDKFDEHAGDLNHRLADFVQDPQCRG